MLGRLRSAGHDVIAIGFDKGLDTIQSNAAVVVSAIERARSLTDDPLVVGGMSMGGIVSRYALLQMEHNGDDHYIGTEAVIDIIRVCSDGEKEKIASTIREIDFANGDVHHFLEHLANGYIRTNF